MITEILLSVAAFWALLGAIGLFRFKDFYTRSHAATMSTVGGVMFALFVLMFGERFLGVYFFRLLIIIILMLLTGPTSAHAIANRAYSLGIEPKGLKRNEMESKPGGGER